VKEIRGGGWHEEGVLAIHGKDAATVALLQLTPRNQAFRLGRRKPGKATQWFTQDLSVPNGRFSLHIGKGDLEIVIVPVDRVTPLDLECKGYTHIDHLQSDFPKVW